MMQQGLRTTAHSDGPSGTAAAPPHTATVPEPLRPTLKQAESFLSVLVTIISADFYKCSVVDVRNAFKWAELMKKHLSSLEASHAASIRNILQCNPSFTGIDIPRALSYPIEYTVELIIRCPLNGFRIGKDVVYLECCRCAYASLGPERTMNIIASVLAEYSDCNAYVSALRGVGQDEAAASSTQEVYEFALVRELASVLMYRLNPNQQENGDIWDDASIIAVLKSAASTDRITLGTLCIFVSTDSATLRARGCIALDVQESLVAQILNSTQLWGIIYEILASDVNNLLAGLHSAVIVKMCRINGEFLYRLESRIIEFAESLLEKCLSSDTKEYGECLFLVY